MKTQKHHHTSRQLTLSLFLILTYFFSPAQAAAQNDELISNDILRVYIDYARSDNTERFIRSEIPFVSYVRDPHLAQLHILITSQHTGGRGTRYKISFIGKEAFSHLNQSLYFISPNTDTDAIRRDGLTQIIKLGMMPFISQTTQANQIEIRSKASTEAAVISTIDDAWDYWTFDIYLGGGLDGEKTRNAFNIRNVIQADRVTEMWKINNRLNLDYLEEKFKDEEITYTSTLREWDFRSSVIRSMTERWSAGLFGEISATTFKNRQFRWSLAPAVEYNIFPWVESERRRFTFAYRAGFRSVRYIEETLFEKTAEKLWFHSLSVELQMTQPWGHVDIELESLHYPELEEKYSLNLDIEFDLRISSGWEFVMGGFIESIHDQIYLPKGDASIEEILLRRRQLATTYALGLNIGFRYTFGSIYNNIINQRL